MKKLSYILTKSSNWGLAGLLSLLGFPSCDKEEPAMYGVPQSTYYIQGKIQNASREGIPDIKLEISSKLSNHNGSNIWFTPCCDPILTNGGGNFSIGVSAFPTDKIRIVATDIDGVKNGSFDKDSIDIEITDADYIRKGDGAWDMGTARKENVILELKQIDIKNE